MHIDKNAVGGAKNRQDITKCVIWDIKAGLLPNGPQRPDKTPKTPHGDMTDKKNSAALHRTTLS